MVKESMNGVDLFDATIQDVEVGDFVWFGHTYVIRPHLRGRVLVKSESEFILQFDPNGPDDFWNPYTLNPVMRNPNLEQREIPFSEIKFIRIVYAVTILRERKWRLG